MSAVEFTHHNLKAGEWYLAYGSPLYIHDRLVKGQTGKAHANIALPAGIDVVCGPACGLLKKQTCAHKTPFVKVDFTGSDAPMVSYVITRLTTMVDKMNNTYFDTTTEQITSRSIGNIMDLSLGNDASWSNPKTWEYKNSIIDNLSAVAVQDCIRKPGASTALSEVSDANMSRAIKLFRALVDKMSAKDAMARDAAWAHGVEQFSTQGTFLGGLGGASNNYDHYSSFNAQGSAFMHGLVLRAARKEFPDDVEKILECYKKVQHAKSFEEKPFDYDAEHVKKLLESRKFTKPVTKADEVVLPF